MATFVLKQAEVRERIAVDQDEVGERARLQFAQFVRALENLRLKREIKDLKALTPLPTKLVGHSPAIGQLRQTLEKVSPTNSRILIVGASGCGNGGGPRAFYTLKDIDSHYFKLGMRWMLTPEQAAPVYQPPLMRKGFMPSLKACSRRAASSARSATSALMAEVKISVS